MASKELILVLIFIVSLSCKPQKESLRKSLQYETEHDMEPDLYQPKLRDEPIKITTDFYKIVLLSFPKNEVFTLNEDKTFDLRIINYGTKELYLPEWFEIGRSNNAEMYIELYKKGRKTFKPYQQKKIATSTSVYYSSTIDREVLQSKNGKGICYKKLPIDQGLKIVDTGEYLAKVYVDLSNFGYFKIQQTDFFFKVTD
ncbi:MAG: hypothetical protein AAF901_07385 [Bacteroidota bacterium]